MQTLIYTLIVICVLIQIACFINELKCVIKGREAIKKYTKVDHERSIRTTRLYAIQTNDHELYRKSTGEILTFSTYNDAIKFIDRNCIYGEWEVKIIGELSSKGE